MTKGMTLRSTAIQAPIQTDTTSLARRQPVTNDATMDDARSGNATNDDLGIELAKLSAAAFAMAQVATERGDFAAHEADARALNDRLEEFRPRIEAAPATEQPALEQVWTDARLDLGYVLSAGELPTSTRMHHFLQGGESAESE